MRATLTLLQLQRTVATLKTPYRNAVRAAFWRGGTSNGLMIKGSDLPVWTRLTKSQKRDLKYCETILQPFFARAFGSPDPYGRQLNGMGGGVSSLSKAVIAERSDVQGVDIDYYFVQIGIKDGMLDMAGNCGNMTAAVAPFAVDVGLLDAKDLDLDFSRSSAAGVVGDVEDKAGGDRTSVVLRNMNTGKKIKADIAVTRKGEGDDILFEEKGNYQLDGVSGTASHISLSFLHPAGAKTGKALPTGRMVDTLVIDGQEVQATLTDISNPGVFVDGRQIGWDPTLTPDQLTSSTETMAFLEKIRRAGTSMMGLNPDVPSIPKIVLVYPPESSGIDLRCQALSMQQAHKASPVTLALNLGVTSKIEGTIPYRLASQRDTHNTVIGHPSGKLEVGAEIEDGHIKGAKLIRTARWLMDGVVNSTGG